MSKVIQLKDNENENLYPINKEIVTGTESPTQEFIDGKQVFVKRINFGALPNNTTKSVEHGLNPNKITVVRLRGMTRRPSDNVIFPLPLAAANFITLLINNLNIQIETINDRSAYTQTYIEIYFYYN